MRVCSFVVLCASAVMWLANGEAAQWEKPFCTSIVPAGAVAVVSASNPAELAQGVELSPLGRIVAGDDGLATELKTALARAQVLFTQATGLPKEQYDALMKGGCTLAILKRPMDSAAGPAPRRLPFLLCLDLSGMADDSRAGFEKSLVASLGLALRGHASISEAAAHSYDIKLGQQPDQHFALAFRGNAMIVGFKADVASLAKTPTLADDQAFNAMLRRIPFTSGISGYVNIAGLLDQLDAYQPNLRRRDSLQMLGIDSFSTFGFNTTISQTGVTDRLFIGFAPQKQSWVGFLPTESRKLAAAALVPPSCDVYASVDLGPGEHTWDSARTLVDELWGAQELENYDNRNEAIELPFGISLRNDIFASIDGEVFFAIDLDKLSDALADEGIDSQKTPYMFGFRVKQRDNLIAAIDRVLQSDVLWGQLGVERRTKEIGEFAAVRLVSPYEPRLMAGYAFIDDYFIFSPNFDMLEEAATAYASGKSLGSDASYQQMRKGLPDTSNLDVFVRESVVSRELLKAYEAGFGDKLEPFLQKLKPNLGKLGDAVAAARIEEDGISVTVNSPGGLALSVLSARSIKRAAMCVKVGRARKILKSTADAIDRYYEANKAYPVQLDVLIPEFLPDMPIDPFGTWGLPVRYGCIPKTDGQPAGGYVLASNGPDGTADCDVMAFDPGKWQARLVRTDDASVAELKAIIYQFNPQANADETDADDEGDIILVRTPPPGKGDAK